MSDTTNNFTPISIILNGILIAIIIALLVIDFNPPTNETICMSYNDPPEKMKSSTVLSMVNHYKDNKLVNLSSSGSADAHSVWFDLVGIKEFIYQLEHTTRLNNSAISDKDLGIRFYYASYPEDFDFSQCPVDPSYKEKHTLVLVPTIEVEGQDLDFDPSIQSTYNGGLYSLIRSNPSMEVFAKNHGSLIPPMMPGVSQEAYFSN